LVKQTRTLEENVLAGLGGDGSKALTEHTNKLQ
jgi:hypothetical protein